MSYGVRRRTALLDGPMGRVTACYEPLDHLGAAKLLVVQVEQHRLTLQDRPDSRSRVLIRPSFDSGTQDWSRP